MILFDTKFWFVLLASIGLQWYQRKYKPGKYGMFMVRLFHGFTFAILGDIVLNFTPGEIMIITLNVTGLFYVLELANGRRGA